MASRAVYYSGTKIVAVAKNYAKHKLEMGGTAEKLERPAFFLKPSSSVVHPAGSGAGAGAATPTIIRPTACKDLHHEVELGVVISRRCKRVRAEAWRDVVGGYVLGLDMTARDLQAAAKKDGMPWTQAKCYDTFTPLSHILPVSAVPDPHALELYLSIDGVEKQRGSTGGMLARIPELVEVISAVMTLEEGDVILTGTPEGVGPVLPGQSITAGITGLVEMTFPVVQEQ